MFYLLICTTNAEHGLSADFRRLVASLEASRHSSENIRLLVLLQKCADEDIHAHRVELPPFVDVYATPDRLSLSEARNRLLRISTVQGCSRPELIVGFPDDDCWFTQDFLHELASVFARSPHLDFWFCEYGSEPEGCGLLGREPRASHIIRKCSSITIFARSAMFDLIGQFDEAIGVGTPNPGGEDIDFALRLFLSGKGMYVGSKLMGHRDRSPSGRGRYFGGSLLAIARYANQRPEIAVEFLRKLMVGVALVFQRELALSSFGSAFRAALKEFAHKKTATRAGR